MSIITFAIVQTVFKFIQLRLVQPNVLPNYTVILQLNIVKHVMVTAKYALDQLSLNVLPVELVSISYQQLQQPVM